VLDFALYKDVSKQKDAVRHALAVDAAGWLWFDGEERIDAQGRYSFRFICSLLSVDPAAIRERALTLSRQDLHRFNGDSGRQG
jgi:hypothetical protein